MDIFCSTTTRFAVRTMQPILNISRYLGHVGGHKKLTNICKLRGVGEHRKNTSVAAKSGNTLRPKSKTLLLPVSYVYYDTCSYVYVTCIGGIALHVHAQLLKYRLAEQAAAAGCLMSLTAPVGSPSSPLRLWPHDSRNPICQCPTFLVSALVVCRAGVVFIPSRLCLRLERVSTKKLSASGAGEERILSSRHPRLQSHSSSDFNIHVRACAKHPDERNRRASEDFLWVGRGDVMRRTTRQQPKTLITTPSQTPPSSLLQANHPHGTFTTE
ncbi:unnamed protein product [Ectocarpus sp. 12 AP-2014]